MMISRRAVVHLDLEADTVRLGAALAAALRAGEALCLSGPLGAGKSVLARAVVLALHPEERDVPSPTFTLVQSYRGGTLSIAHLDLYRLASPGEAYELGLEDALSEGAAVIEWADRLGDDLPPDRLDVVLSLRSPTEPVGARLATLTPHGAWAGRVIDL